MDLSSIAAGIGEQWQSTGPVLRYVFAFLGGAVASLTPCVYPLLPIVAITIGASNTSGTKAQAFSLSLVYALGLAIVYALLGVLAGLVGVGLGQIATHPYAYLTIALFFSFFALMMFDIYTMPVPRMMMTASAGAQQRRGYFAVGVTGALSGVIAAPCLGPVVLFILTYIASKGDPVTGFFMMFLFALGVATLPVVVGTFAGMATTFQKMQGAWMTRIKHVFGWAFIFFALFYAFSAGKNYVPASPSATTVAAVDSAVNLGGAGAQILADVVTVENGDAPQWLEDKPLDIEYVSGSETMKLSDTFTPGTVTLLTFWSTNCALCIEEMPHLLETYSNYHGRGFEVLSVNVVTNESRSTVEAFVANRQGMDFTVIFDGEHKIWDAYNLFGTPTNILFDGEGKILYYGVVLPPKLEKLIEENTQV